MSQPDSSPAHEQRLVPTLILDVHRQWRERGKVGKPDSGWTILRELGNHRFHPVLLMRLSLATASRRSRISRFLARVLSFLNLTVYGVEVALQTRIGPGLYLPHAGGIVIGSREVGSNVTIFQGVTLGASSLDLNFEPGKRPRIADEVVISAGAKVLGGIDIGESAIIGANAVVLQDVPPGDVVGGVPARSLRQTPRPALAPPATSSAKGEST